MKKVLTFLISAVLLIFQVSAQGTYSKSGSSSSGNSSGNPTFQQGASQSSGSVYRQTAAPAASEPRVTASPSAAPAARRVSAAPRTYTNNTRIKTEGIRVNTETDPVSREGSGSGNSVLPGNPDISRKDSPDTTLVMSRSDAKVTFYGDDGKTCDLSAKGYYGVLIGGYEDLEKCKRDLKKYEVQFRERGYICEDWTLQAIANQKQMPYQLIIGYYLSKTDVYHLWLEIQSYFPFCRIVKYA